MRRALFLLCLFLLLPGLAFAQVSSTSGSPSVSQDSTTSGQRGPLVQCAVTTGAPTYTTGKTDPLSCDTTGGLRVNMVAGGGGAVTIADGADTTLGAKADAKSTATDTTAISAMSVLKQISASVQAPPSQAVTNTGTFAAQAAITAASGSIASGAIASGAVASGAYASGSIADGAQVTLGAKADAKSTATDTTAITAMQVLKQISASVQAPPSQAVTNAGTFATQSAITAASGAIASGAIASGAVASGAIASGAVASGAYASGSISDGAQVTLGAKADAKSTATDSTSITVMQVLKQISASVQAPPSQAVTNTGTFAVQSTNAAETTKVLGTVRAQGNLGAAFDAATGAAPPANAVYLGGLVSGATGGFVGPIPISDTVAVVNISTITTTLIVTGVSGRHVRIGALNLVTAAANNIAFLSGTGATCGTGTAGMTGGTTAASGWNFAANGGIAQGTGLGTIMKTVATGDSVCIITSATTQLSGTVSYTIY